MGDFESNIYNAGVAGKILVVDDSEDNLDLLKLVLARNKYNVEVERGGKGALEHVHSSKPDLILLDIHMPDMSGFEVCQELKDDIRTASIPIIFISALDDVSEKLKAFSMGGVDYISKPFHSEEILARVQTHLTLRLQHKFLLTKNDEMEREIRKREFAEENLRRYERIVSATPDRISLIDSDYVFKVVNDAYLVANNKKQDEILGRNSRDVLGEKEFNEKLKEHLDNCLAGETVYYQEWMEFESLGRQFMSVTYSPYHDIDEKISGVLISARDITESKRAEEAILNAYDELSARVVELSTLNSIMKILTTVENLDSVLASVCETICNLFNSRGGVISLIGSNLQDLVALAYYFRNSPESPPSRTKGIRIDSDPIVTKIEKEKKSVLIERATEESGGPFHELLGVRNGECLFHIPLQIRGELIGTISVLGNLADRKFTFEDVKLGETVAGQIAGAVENARLFEEEQKINAALSAANRRMEDDMSFARDIQYSLLRPPRPDWGGVDAICYTMPARSVGGDFYAYHSFLDGRFALAVGDVSGKGVPAALLMATCLSQFDAALNMDLEPNERFNHLDRAIMPYTRLRGQNCALCYLEIQLPESPETHVYPEMGKLSLVNAGCIPPFIKRQTGKVEWPAIGGLPLGQGLGSLKGYRGMDLHLAPGDMIILTSDGVVEASNPEGELLGFERLEQFMERGSGG